MKIGEVDTAAGSVIRASDGSEETIIVKFTQTSDDCIEITVPKSIVLQDGDILRFPRMVVPHDED